MPLIPNPPYTITTGLTAGLKARIQVSSVEGGLESALSAEIWRIPTPTMSVEAATPNEVTMPFGQVMTGDLNGWQVEVDTGSGFGTRAVSALNGSGTSVLRLVFGGAAVTPTDSIRVTYNRSLGITQEQGGDSALLETYIQIAATNNVSGTVPGVPTSFTSPQGSKTTIDLTWDAEPASTSYIVTVDDVDQAEVGVTTYTASGFTAGTKHKFELRGKNASGEGAKTSAIFYITVPDMSVEAANPNQVNMSFPALTMQITDATGIDVRVNALARNETTTAAGIGFVTVDFDGAAVIDTDTVTLDYDPGGNIQESGGDNAQLVIFDMTYSVTNNAGSGYVFTNTHSMIIDQADEGITANNDAIYPRDGGGDTPFTIEIWWKAQAVLQEGTTRIMFYGKDGAVNGILQLSRGGPNQWQFRMRTSIGNDKTINFNRNIFASTWFHILISMTDITDDVTPGYEFYVDGTPATPYTLESTGTYTGIPVLTSPFTCEIPVTTSSGFEFKGKYNLYRWYNIAVSQAQATTLYNGGSPFDLNGDATLLNAYQWELPFNNNFNANGGPNGTGVGSPTFDTDLPPT